MAHMTPKTVQLHGTPGLWPDRFLGYVIRPARNMVSKYNNTKDQGRPFRSYTVHTLHARGGGRGRDVGRVASDSPGVHEARQDLVGPWYFVRPKKYVLCRSRQVPIKG